MLVGRFSAHEPDSGAGAQLDNNDLTEPNPVVLVGSAYEFTIDLRRWRDGSLWPDSTHLTLSSRNRSHARPLVPVRHLYPLR